MEETVEEKTIEQKTIEAFNVKTQQMEEAVVTVDRNGEFLFTFEDGSFFKLPSTSTVEDINALLEARRVNNEGQVSLEAQEKVLEELVGGSEPADEETEEDPE